jgi:hypothetical protein
MLLISTGLISWGLFIGMVGMGFFIYGKKSADGLFLISGLALMIYPYFVGSLMWSVIIGVIICVVTFILKYVVRI